MSCRIFNLNPVILILFCFGVMKHSDIANSFISITFVSLAKNSWISTTEAAILIAQSASHMCKEKQRINLDITKNVIYIFWLCISLKRVGVKIFYDIIRCNQGRLYSYTHVVFIYISLYYCTRSALLPVTRTPCSMDWRASGEIWVKYSEGSLRFCGFMRMRTPPC